MEYIANTAALEKNEFNGWLQVPPLPDAGSLKQEVLMLFFFFVVESFTHQLLAYFSLTFRKNSYLRKFNPKIFLFSIYDMILYDWKKKKAIRMKLHSNECHVVSENATRKVGFPSWVSLLLSHTD